MSSEAALTGEPEDMKKTKNKDPFMLSSCLITSCDETRCIVIGTGTHSQWGKIKSSLVMESVNTPLQDKLETMTEMVSLLLLYFYFHCILHDFFIFLFLFLYCIDWIFWYGSCCCNIYCFSN